MKFRPSKRDRSVFGKLASEYNLTYYGTVLPNEFGDYAPVRGLTASPEQLDDNYTSGNLAGFKVDLLQRSHDIFSTNNKKLNRTWSMCQVNLNKSRLSHMYISGRGKTDECGSLLASYLRIYEISPSSLGPTITGRFLDSFSIYIYPNDIPILNEILTSDVQTMLATHFSNMDIEINQDKLIVYSLKKPIDVITLDKMLRIAVWLARRLDSLNTN